MTTKSYTIVYYSRSNGRAVTARYETLTLASKAASAVFEATGVVLGIEEN